LPNSSKFAATVNVRYEFAIGGWSTFVAGNFAYEGDRNSSFPGNASNYRLPSYSTVDVNGGVSISGFDLGLYVRNLTDERGQTAITGTSNGAPGKLVAVTRPRTVGLTVSRVF
jgi:outer membrane receptor protein involved in Fe transport